MIYLFIHLFFNESMREHFLNKAVVLASSGYLLLRQNLMNFFILFPKEL